jgi:hypothetical protein
MGKRFTDRRIAFSDEKYFQDLTLCQTKKGSVNIKIFGKEKCA